MICLELQAVMSSVKITCFSFVLSPSHIQHTYITSQRSHLKIIYQRPKTKIVKRVIHCLIPNGVTGVCWTLSPVHIGKSQGIHLGQVSSLSQGTHTYRCFLLWEEPGLHFHLLCISLYKYKSLFYATLIFYAQFHSSFLFFMLLKKSAFWFLIIISYFWLYDLTYTLTYPLIIRFFFSIIYFYAPNPVCFYIKHTLY